jgi:hypothetical protein
LHVVIDVEGIEQAPGCPTPKSLRLREICPCNPASGAVDNHKAHGKRLRLAVLIRLNARQEMLGVFHLCVAHAESRRRVPIDVEEDGAAKMPIPRVVSCVEAW